MQYVQDAKRMATKVFENIMRVRWVRGRVRRGLRK
jgi:hypothetical protein